MSEVTKGLFVIVLKKNEKYNLEKTQTLIPVFELFGLFL